MLGVLNLETNKPERFTEDTFEFIKLIATRAAVAIENSQLYQIAQDQLARVQELYNQVSELEKLKTDMIRIAAHDLRNPVGVIVGYLELLEWSLEGPVLTLAFSLPPGAYATSVVRELMKTPQTS